MGVAAGPARRHTVDTAGRVALISAIDWLARGTKRGNQRRVASVHARRIDGDLRRLFDTTGERPPGRRRTAVAARPLPGADGPDPSHAADRRRVDAVAAVDVRFAGRLDLARLGADFRAAETV